MPWNYRVVKVEEEGEDPFYEIRLALYPKGSMPDSSPTEIGTTAIAMAGLELEDIADELEKCRRALTMPVLIEKYYLDKVDVDPQEYE